jgi:hypothetical protein
MPYPTEYWDSEALRRGGLWRCFLNRVPPHGEITADTIRQLVQFYCEEARGKPIQGYLWRLPDYRRQHGSDIDRDLAQLGLGMRIWREHAAALARAVAEHDGVAPDSAARRAREAWFSDPHSVYDRESPQWRSVLAVIRTGLAEAQRAPELTPLMASELLLAPRLDLSLVLDIEAFRDIAAKTWPAKRDEGRQPWTCDELHFVNGFYQQQVPYLRGEGELHAGDPVDPTDLTAWRAEADIGVGPEGLSYVTLVIMAAVVIDFAEELVDFNTHEAAKGSLRCDECGQFAPRSFYGHGQLYCSEQCKRRAAKRRYRSPEAKLKREIARRARLSSQVG